MTYTSTLLAFMLTNGSILLLSHTHPIRIKLVTDMILFLIFSVCHRPKNRSRTWLHQSGTLYRIILNRLTVSAHSKSHSNITSLANMHPDLVHLLKSFYQVQVVVNFHFPHLSCKPMCSLVICFSCTHFYQLPSMSVNVCPYSFLFVSV